MIVKISKSKQYATVLKNVPVGKLFAFKSGFIGTANIRTQDGWIYLNTPYQNNQGKDYTEVPVIIFPIGTEVTLIQS